MPSRNPAEMHIDEAEWSMLLDGDSLPSERLEHQAACSACSREWRVRRSLRDTLRHAPPAPLPSGLSTRISAALSRSATTGGNWAEELPGWLLWWGRPVGMMVAAALLVFSVLLAPRLASRAAALPNEWAWAAGLRTSQDPLASEWAEDTLVIGIAGPAAYDVDNSTPATPPGGQRHPPAASAS